MPLRKKTLVLFFVHKYFTCKLCLWSPAEGVGSPGARVMVVLVSSPAGTVGVHAAELSFLPSILSFTKNVSSDLSTISDMPASRHALFRYLLHLDLFSWCFKSRWLCLRNLFHLLAYLSYSILRFCWLYFCKLSLWFVSLNESWAFQQHKSTCLFLQPSILLFFRFYAWQACMTVLWFSL